MHRDEGPPPIDQKHRMPLRVVAIFVCYALYLFASSYRLVPAILLGFGALLVALSLIDRWTLSRSERSGPMQVGTTLLGGGLVALGLVLLLIS